jgi:hypothetical protein
MKNTINELIEAEAKLLGIPSTAFYQYVGAGTKILFSDKSSGDLNSLKKFGLDENDLREFILLCAYGGVLETRMLENVNYPKFS